MSFLIFPTYEGSDCEQVVALFNALSFQYTIGSSLERLDAIMLSEEDVKILRGAFNEQVTADFLSLAFSRGKEERIIEILKDKSIISDDVKPRFPSGMD